jgi:uncharacterized protein YjiS (DUF1127 family)
MRVTMQPQLNRFHLADKRQFTLNLISEVRALCLGAWSVARKWARRWHCRRELRSLSQREIADFCPKLTEALKEAEKPFWRA